MQTFTQTLGQNAATLTGYVQEPSDELANARVRPAVLVLPGGGYIHTSDREAEPVALAYLAEGFNAFVLRYAVGDAASFAMALSDAEHALAWIRDHAAQLHIDPARVAVVGFSAGGHLAASLGTLAEGKQIPDLPERVTSQTPPTFLFSTAGDELVPIRHSLALLTALAHHQVPFESHIYLRGQHGLSLSKPLTANGHATLVEDSVVPWLADSVRFLRSVLGDFAVGK